MFVYHVGFCVEHFRPLTNTFLHVKESVATTTVYQGTTTLSRFLPYGSASRKSLRGVCSGIAPRNGQKCGEKSQKMRLPFSYRACCQEAFNVSPNARSFSVYATLFLRLRQLFSCCWPSLFGCLRLAYAAVHVCLLSLTTRTAPASSGSCLTASIPSFKWAEPRRLTGWVFYLEWSFVQLFPALLLGPYLTHYSNISCSSDSQNGSCNVVFVLHFQDTAIIQYETKSMCKSSLQN